MAENSKIEWTTHTASPWHGCAHAHLPDGTPHPGCLSCYAESMSVRNPGTLGVWGDNGTRIKSKSFVDKLRRWNRSAQAAGEAVTVFPSICDPFEDRPELDPWRREMFAVLDECPWVVLLALTKRPQNALRMTPAVEVQSQQQADDRNERGELYRRNVHLGVSASNQQTWDWATAELVKLHGLSPVRFISLEPFLAPVRCGCTCFLCENTEPGGGVCRVCRVCRVCGKRAEWRSLNQIIIGCESDGPRVGSLGEFQSEPHWIKAAEFVVHQCREVGMPVFVKQIPLNGRVCHDLDRFPETLRVRQFPQPKAPR